MDSIFIAQAILQPADPGGIRGIAGVTHVNVVAHEHDIATFQEFTGLFGQVDRIDLKLVAGPAADLPASLTALLPPGVVVRSPSARSQSGRGMIRAYQISLTFLSFISLFVGMFLVYSLVALNAAARRRELAVMRATGASTSPLSSDIESPCFFINFKVL